MNCQIFSTGFNSGHLGGKGMMEMLAGTSSLSVDVPSGLIHQHDGMAARRDRLRYFCQMQRHGFGIAERQHQTGGLAVFRAAPSAG